jgi:signal transduction histidine kinase/CheY-like chemotaxis protein
MTPSARAPRGAARVMSTRTAELAPSAPADLVDELGLAGSSGFACVPIVSRGRVLGCLSLVLTQPGRRFDDAALALFEELALRVGVALDNASLYALAQRERANLEGANKAKDEFLATLSHELRTPLNAILGWTHLLREGHLDDAARERAIETVERNAKAQAQLIADLLDVSRIVTGKVRLVMRQVKLPQVIDAAVDAVRLAAQARSISLESRIDPRGAEALADPDRLRQVLWNILSNALKFTPRSGKIEVRLERRGGAARISVTDNGQGIPRDFLPHVFDRFRQADSSSTRAHGGLGLGLAIASHLISEHGGTICAESEGAGKGASFIIELPLVDGQIDGRLDARSDGPPSSERGPSSWRPELDAVNVLVVDDDPDGREALRAMLEQEGAFVTTVGSAAEALEVVCSRPPDMMLCDIGLPGEDGYSLIRRIRQVTDGATLPAAALTAYASARDRERALAAGFQAHVPKPLDPGALMTVLLSFGYGRRRTPLPPSSAS